MLLQTWSDTLALSFKGLWVGFMDFVPNIVVAIIIFAIGWVVGASLAKVVSQVIKLLRVDSALKVAGVEDMLKKGNIALDSGHFLGELVKWFIIIAFLVASFSVLGLNSVNDFLSGVVLTYLPRVIAAVLILLVSVVIAEAVKKIVISASQATGVKTAGLLGSTAKWSIWLFAVLAALYQLGIAGVLIQTLFTGLVIAVSLAVGLAFGLGGQEAAARYIEEVKDEISHH